MTWKLPKELEPFREYLDYYMFYTSIEESFKHGTETEKTATVSQINLLQRLIKAGLLYCFRWNKLLTNKMVRK